VQGGVTWNSVEGKTGLYSVSYADFSSAGAATAAMNDYLAGTRGKAASVRDLTVSGGPGKEVVFELSKESTMWLRVVVKGNRLYKVVAGNKNIKAKAYEFLDSFKVDGS
jgi:hypothetical protein